MDADSILGGLLTRVASVLDAAALYGMRLAFGDALLPPLRDFPGLRASADPYLVPALRNDPGLFLSSLSDEAGPRHTRAVAREPIAGGGTIVTRQFASRYRPYHSDGASIAASPENETLWIDHWMHGSRPGRVTLLAIHGLGMGWRRIDARALMVEHWFRQGMDVAVLTLPFHGPRAPRHSRYSGECFISWNVGHLNEAVRQSVHDAWGVCRWLLDRGTGSIGVVGLSLGGYIAALLAALVPELAFAVPVVPAVHLEDLPMRLFAESRYGRAGLAAPLNVEELRAAYRVHSPLARAVRVPRSRLLVVAAHGDGVTPGAHAEALWNHWQRPAATWFSGGHVTPFQRSRTVAAIVAHLRTVGAIEDAPSVSRPRLARASATRAVA